MYETYEIKVFNRISIHLKDWIVDNTNMNQCFSVKPFSEMMLRILDFGVIVDCVGKN